MSWSNLFRCCVDGTNTIDVINNRMQKLKMKTYSAHLPSCHPMLRVYTVSILKAMLSNPILKIWPSYKMRTTNGILSYIASFKYEEMAKCSHFHIISYYYLRICSACIISLYKTVNWVFRWLNTGQLRGTRQRSWLWHYATSRKVVGTILDVIRYFD
jgi:hypothetical protein